MKNILFIHQSAELYGSDKTLLLLMKYIDKKKFYPVVILPNNGPLKEELEKENIEVIILPVIKLHRKMFTPKNILLCINQIKNGFSELNILQKKYNFEIIYSNTLAVLLGYLFAKKKGIKHIWHVHEIIESPKIVAKFFNFLLNSKSNSYTIYNSQATASFWESISKKKDNYKVITNGLEIPSKDVLPLETTHVRENLFMVNNELVIGLVGRINRWKGQFILLEAFKYLTKKHSNLKLIFIGSTTENQSYILEELESNINTYNLKEDVKIIPFQSNITKIWSAIDIAIVPSTEPEPFGLVAVEAMLAKKPVIASNHGGLTEIIKNNETGFLFEPNNVQELSEAIDKLIRNEELRKEMGISGYKRVIEKFSIQKYVSNIEKILEK